MIAAAFALVLMQEAAPSVVWETSAAEPPATAATAVAPATPHSVPAWGLADPFGFERARCSPLVRGAKSMETCQTEVRAQLATALGPDLPEALRPAGMAGDCHMMQASAGGGAYSIQCGPQSRAASAPSGLREMDCRPRPVEGGFSSECRPVDETGKKGMSLILWGVKND